MSHRIKKDWKSRLKAAVPFGLGHTKPQHFRDMAKVAWTNRDNLGYGWKVLSRGVCDGCALGVAGFHDWTIKGVHLCMTRLNLLRLNTMPELDVRLLEDIRALRGQLATMKHPLSNSLREGSGTVMAANQDSPIGRGRG